ncbi:tRNA 5-methylaminomethyl-2-thiouridine biosynthesis bifunctional protein [Allopseudospirillum japonicum]|uniref:tRNA 5-methylaminomethyl-2-thiouridine biosynthesis bifunctional protein MnmC n=1 Tax=Allopseudospirillum japonicum TaxID=64971 RepID=A0A1H6QU49_9GAMM|nr:bifunctional tRNA (5-methylaminomethyl-2-thiouridine)(34)-methyltransferase MnmD/FAD-dependent 5-carboxymethylaminomethyl-2-thiouridine(34) oxidoreductase MnmC [Allopseudospirillum japonicum]SEI47093.1 tRNA 5-methylaminomethyl-2-thiouridine biosynthesis bifunctional protein [Allopseudospirillum japonicum]
MDYLQALTPAHLDWQNQQPYAQDFADVYFSRDQGLAETHYVFLQQNQLQQRWSQLSTGQHFVIAETGFGTGLNMLAACAHFMETAPEGTYLHLVSVEKYPLTREDLTRALAAWPQLASYSTPLLAAYPPLVKGSYRLQLSHRVSLTLHFGDALAILSQLEMQVHAWFLDGFAPARNPDLWQPALFTQMARLSAPDASFATFTAAGMVKRGLQEAGFHVRKVAGFGRKREMLSGYLLAPTKYAHAKVPFFYTPKPKQPPQAVTLIGAGMAGAASARFLADLGVKVRVLEAATQVAAGASGNRQGALYIKLAAQANRHSAFYWQGLYQSWQQLQQMSKTLWDPCGVLQLAYNAQEQKRQQGFLQNLSLPEAWVQAVDAQQASQLAGVPVQHSGLFFPQAGYVRPALWCQALLDHPNIDVITGVEVTQLHFDAEQHVWHLFSQDATVYQASHVVLANAYAAKKLLAQMAPWLPIKSIRGQITHLATQQAVPQTVICHEGYLAPPLENTLCLGASFNLGSHVETLCAQDQANNLALLQHALPEFAASLNTPLAPLAGRVGFRCTSPDYLPLVGPIPQEAGFKQMYAPLSKDASWRPETHSPYAPYWPHLWVNLAHGSRGLASVVLSAQILAAHMGLIPAPVSADLLQGVHPARFLVKALIQART